MDEAPFERSEELAKVEFELRLKQHKTAGLQERLFSGAVRCGWPLFRRQGTKLSTTTTA